MAAAAPAPDLKTLGRYNLERVLGKGAMGVVYEGVDPRLGRRVAIKTILKSHLDEDTAKDYSMRFVREAQAVARLNHPNVVQVFDFGEEGDIAYLVMEFIKGKELKSFFDANERFDLKEAVRIMGELCDALDFAHNAGIIHRDIKPANVMIDSQGRTKLTDFGVARVQDSDKTSVERTQAGTMVGTPAYMSPEQITGGNIDKRTDVFSAGIILYQFLTGEKPFSGSGAWTIAKKIIQEEPPLPSSLNNAITPLFDAVVNKALSKNPDTRFQSARDLGVALKRALEGKGIEDDSDKTVAGAMTGDFAALARPAPAVAKASPQESQRTGGTGTQAGGNQEVELEFWRAIKDGNDPDDFELYVQQFPNGIYAALAKRKIAKLRGVPMEESTAKAKEQEKREQEEAARREAEAKSKLEAEKARLEAEMAKKEEEYKRREAEAQARAEKARQDAEAAAEKARQEAAAAAEKARQEAAAELAKREAEFKKREAEAQARLGMDAKARAEAEEKARKEAVEKARQEAAAEMARKEAEYKKRETERAEAEAKARAEAEAKAKVEAAARAKQAAEEKAKREAELKARAEQEAKQKAEFAKREADLKKQVEEAESASGGKKRAIKYAVIVGVLIAALAGTYVYFFGGSDQQTKAQLAAMQKQLEEAKKKAEEADAAKKKAEEAQVALEKAKKAEEDARKSGDVAKQKELEQARKLAEAEARKQAEASRAADAQKLAADKSAAEARSKADAKKDAEAKKVADAKAAADRAAAEKAAADRAAAEKAATDKLAAEKAALEAERARIAAEKAQAEKEKLAAEKLAAEAKAAAEKAAKAQTSGAPGSGNQYQVALNFETEGKGKEAVKAYTQAARGGNCEAAKRLGDIYDKGLIGITRDYAESLKWYNAARVLGCDVPLQQRRG
ncbi:MAG TPA: protein kinase [Burkholderiales bacterium]|nr:protein kinase [Burkholderiales bacterium]